jgi:signal transduction histidine kinase
MGSAVIVIRRDGTLAVINDEAYRIFSLTPQARDVGRPFAEALQARPELTRVLSAAFEAPTGLPNRAELRLTDPDRLIGLTLSQVRDDDGGVIGAVLIFKDLTHVEHLRTQAHLRDRLASLGEMAASIAHELKNPLAAIAVAAGLLKRLVPTQDAHAIVADIVSEVRSATAIVDQMLDYVRPLRLRIERADVLEVLSRAKVHAESAGLEGQRTIHMRVSPDLPLVAGDADQLCQVFGNLLTNAREAVGEHGRIDVSAEVLIVEQAPALFGDPVTRTPTVIIDVIDDGPGVPPDFMERIFDPFFTTKVQGTGIGLAIVRKIVHAHNGRIDPTRLPGGGMRFRVMLPAA